MVYVSNAMKEITVPFSQTLRNNLVHLANTVTKDLQTVFQYHQDTEKFLEDLSCVKLDNFHWEVVLLVMIVQMDSIKINKEVIDVYHALLVLSVLIRHLYQ